MRRWTVGVWIAMALAAVPVAALAQQQPTITYTYDTLGRVTSATYVGGPNDGLVITYTYDAAGNRTQYTSNGAGNTHTPNMIIVPLMGFTMIVAGP
jgi:YD repeat-containing protein